MPALELPVLVAHGMSIIMYRNWADNLPKALGILSKIAKNVLVVKFDGPIIAASDYGSTHSVTLAIKCVKPRLIKFKLDSWCCKVLFFDLRKTK